MPMPLVFNQPENVTDTSTNGGRMVNKAIVMTVGGSGNFPVLSEAERLAGVTKSRKVFIKLADSSNPTATQGTVFLSAPSLLTDSRAYLVKGTQRDQQAAMDTRRYATGILNTGIAANDTVLIVDFELGSGADLVVQAGDTIAIVEGAIEDRNLIVDSVTWDSDQATITLTSSVLHDFTNAAAVASCIVDTDNINPKFDNLVKSFSTSTYDETTYPILTNNLATLEETITLTISGATAFTVLSDKRGALSAGSTLSDYSPSNADFSLPYFTVSAAGWGGTHTVGETMQFQVHPAAIPVWLNQETVADASIGSDAAYLSVRIEA